MLMFALPLTCRTNPVRVPGVILRLCPLACPTGLQGQVNPLSSSETTVLKTRFGPGDAGDPLSPSIAFERTSTERSCHLPRGPGLSRPSMIRDLLTNPPKPYDLSWQRLSDVLRFRKNVRIIPDGFRNAYCSQLSAAPSPNAKAIARSGPLHAELFANSRVRLKLNRN
jgi:hypothetical protein